MAANPERRNFRIWLSLAGAGVALFVLPWVAGMDGMKGGYALQFIAVALVLPMGLAGAYITRKRARLYDKILAEEGLLAHWITPPLEWRLFCEAELKRERSEKRFLFLLISGFAVFFSGLFSLLDHRAAPFLLWGAAGFVAFMGAVAALSVWLPHRRRVQSAGETRIHREALLTAGALHAWTGSGARLESVEMEREEEGLLLAFTYSFPVRNGRDTRTARIPVPPGKEEAAEAVRRFFTGGEAI
ncbi:MAG: hypothetical protein ACP5VN_03370 [Acidobacteriota bacterium]